MIEGFNLTGYLLFALVTSITPGPNNYLLFSYGKQYGFTDSHKFMLGIFVGFSTLLYMAGYGIGELITQYPTLHLILKGISSVWLFYLAIVMSKLEIGLPEQTNSKMGFYQGFFLQFVNPKAWIMSITGASAYLPQMANIHWSVFLFVILFGVVGIPCMITWIYFGDIMEKWITSPIANKIISLILLLLMLLSIGMVWI